MDEVEQDKQNWFGLAHLILVRCRPLGERVAEEGSGLMLTDTDKSVLEGFRIVLNRSSYEEFRGLCRAASMTSTELNGMVALHEHRRRQRL